MYSVIHHHLQTATTLIQNSQSKLDILNSFQHENIFSSKNISEMIIERERLERLLTALPSYAQDAIADQLNDLNEKLREKIVEDYERRWDNMTIEDRKAVLQELHNQIAEELGIDPLELQFHDLDGSEGDKLGEYSDGEIKWWFDTNQSIKIDIENVSGYDDLNSFSDLRNAVAHETRHQYQQYLIDHPEERPPHISEEQISEWKDNLDNYIRYEDDPEGYYNQPVEVDSRIYQDNFENTFYENELENYS